MRNLPGINFSVGLIPPWLMVLCINITATFVIAPILIKKAADSVNRDDRFVWQYFFAMSIATALFCYSIAERSAPPNIIWIGVVMLVGVANGFAAYCQWRAAAISLSINGIASVLDDVIAVLLALIFLNEANFMNWMTTAGACGALTAVLCVGKLSNQTDEGQMRSVLKWVLGYSLIWGVVTFLNGVFARAVQLPLPEFLFGWYAGSFISALIVRFVLCRRENLSGSWREKNAMLSGAILGATIISCLGVGYINFKLMPLTVLIPILLVAGSICPALVGYFIFAEGAKFNRGQKMAMIFGVICVALIGYGFYSSTS